MKVDVENVESNGKNSKPKMTLKALSKSFKEEMEGYFNSEDKEVIADRKKLAHGIVGDTQGFTGKLVYHARHGKYSAPIILALDALAWTAGIIEVVGLVKRLRA